MGESNHSELGRRAFVGAAAAANLMILKPELVRGYAANSAVRLGLLGCGGRGTGVATSFVENAGARLTALGDLFSDQLERGKAHFDRVAAKLGQTPVANSQLFHGPNAYQELFGSKEVDAVYIATPVYFHPMHLEAAVAEGKHVYVEKPLGVDVPAVRRSLRAAEKARGRLSVTVGLQLRHATPYVEQVKRVHSGALGEIVSGLVHYYAGPIERPAWPDASPAERRLRNWVWDIALSGDIIVEQNVHVIDFTNWLLAAHPLKASGGVRGRNGRTDTGDCSSHYECTFTYPNDVHISFASTQFIKGAWDVAMRFFGSQGTSEAHYDAPVRILGDHPWEFPGLGAPGQVVDGKAAVAGKFHGALDDADANKQKAFIASITSGNYLNEVMPAAEATMSAIMGRMAAETGSDVRWDDVVRSEQMLDARLDLGAIAR